MNQISVKKGHRLKNRSKDKISTNPSNPNIVLLGQRQWSISMACKLLR